jgi:hypothetical protein
MGDEELMRGAVLYLLAVTLIKKKTKFNSYIRKY